MRNTLTQGIVDLLVAMPAPANRTESKVLEAVTTAWWSGATFVIQGLMDAFLGATPEERLKAILLQLDELAQEISDHAGGGVVQ